ncbi:pyridoxine [Saccharata proteae CBS 121410]|uniref:glutaminase n=1 Tax=Saccharata proteae CBS 121410 TaxID=1314787 RepID=A0A9P4LZN6_9PEZI|nr:pyridoxine [Saccharata proteae CBS 121410]
MTSSSTPRRNITIGVLALQGAFSEHVQLLRQAISKLKARNINDSESYQWECIEVRTPAELARCDALVLPGGESTTMSLVAQRSGMLEPLREFVKAQRNPVWGTCAGLILLAESANRTKKGGQELIGGLDVRVARNHFGRQTESFTADLNLPFLRDTQGLTETEASTAAQPFRSVFIRAPVVEKVLSYKEGEQADEAAKEETIVAPSKSPQDEMAKREVKEEVEILARLPPRARTIGSEETAKEKGEDGDIIAVRQGNVFGTSFHPELTGDARIHVWWLERVIEAIERRANKSVS